MRSAPVPTQSGGSAPCAPVAQAAGPTAFGARTRRRSIVNGDVPRSARDPTFVCSNPMPHLWLAPTIFYV